MPAAVRSWLVTSHSAQILPHAAGLPHARVVKLARGLRRVHVGQASPDVQPAVLAVWQKYNAPFEGIEKFLYTDAIGLVTTGMGDLVDSSQSGSSAPWAPALALPWRNRDGSLASQSDVIAAWQKVKSAWPGMQSTNCASLTSIRLDDAGVQQAVSTTLAADAQILARHFPNWATMPADAQLAILSMAWAMGAGFAATFKQFTADINAGNYAAAAAQSGFQGVGVAGRIAADKLALSNAQIVADRGLDPATVYWPGDASDAPAPGSSLLSLLLAGAAIGGAVMLARRYGPDVVTRAEHRLAPA